jgi:hypothetical protein
MLICPKCRWTSSMPIRKLSYSAWMKMTMNYHRCNSIIIFTTNHGFQIRHAQTASPFLFFFLFKQKQFDFKT